MKTLSAKGRKSRTGFDYLGLIRKFPLRPIRQESDLEQAMGMVRMLAIWEEGTLSPGEQDYLEALTVLLEDYDRKHPYKVKATGLDLLKQLMEEHAMSAAELGKIVGSQPLASMILSGKREMSKDVMRRLGAYFHLDAGAFF